MQITFKIVVSLSNEYVCVFHIYTFKNIFIIYFFLLKIYPLTGMKEAENHYTKKNNV